MVQLCNKGMKSHQSYTSAFLPIATFASVACMPRRQQPGTIPAMVLICMYAFQPYTSPWTCEDDGPMADVLAPKEV